MKFLVLASLLLTFTFAHYNSAQASAPSSDCKTLLELLNVKDPSVGVGWRGYLGDKAPKNPNTIGQGLKLGIMNWGIRIYIVSTQENIIKHDALQTNPLVKGFYLISDFRITDELEKNMNSSDNSQKLLAQAFAEQKFIEIVEKKGMYHVDENGVLQQIDISFVKENFDPAKIEIIGEAERSENIFYYRGWFAPKVKGVILQSDIQPSVSETYKKLLKVSRSLINKGYKVTFNKDFKGAMALLAKQQRFIDHLVTKEKMPVADSANRFKDADEVAKEIKSFEEGHSFSVEVWSPEGRLVGGTVGHREGNIFSPDSVFYDKEYSDDAITFAKISVMALMDRLSRAGISFVDAGMRTPFTASMKGRYIPRAEYVSLINSLPDQKLEVDLTSDWLPPVTASAKK